jgi:hypothetical protein
MKSGTIPFNYNKIIKIIIIIVIILLTFIGGYELPFIHQKPLPKPIPIENLKPLPYGSQSYIKNDILYTSVVTIPIACITKITREGDNIVIIDYTISSTHIGMLAISYVDYVRLFGGK